MGNDVLINGLHKVYLPANLAWAVAWYDHIISIHVKEESADAKIAHLLSDSSTIVYQLESGYTTQPIGVN